jgi:hypothetical protein
MARKPLFILMMITTILLAACGSSGGSSGSAFMQKQSCRAIPSGGACEGSFGRIKGTVSADIESANSGFLSFNAEVNASVESGRVRVYLIDSEGSENATVMEPGKAVKLTGDAMATFDGFRIYFETLDGEAKGVKFNVEFAAR